MRFLVCLAFVLVGSVGSSLQAAPDYLKEIKPLLQRRCISCHGALKQKGGLRLDARAGIMRGGDNGPSIEPGKADSSILIHVVTGKEGLQRMPLEGEPLSADEIELLKAWVNAGAVAPDEPLPPDPRQHWAFQKPQRQSPPTTERVEWNRNPLDAFLHAEHQRLGLSPRPEAPRNVLLRRIYLDLIGVPPTRRETQDFVSDPSPDAYEKVVDRLLASPQYGERWARHWMDVWRYSDWDGYGAEIRESQAHIWRWRDWIVKSLNMNQGYDQMVQQMLAADELSPEETSNLPATGFLVRNYFRFNRNIWLDNTVEHTGKAFMGLTWNCARCHDHMYDPISQQEYYQLRSFFEPYDVRIDRLPNQADVTKDGLARIYDAHASTPTFLFTRGDEKHPVKDKPILPATPNVLTTTAISIAEQKLPSNAYYPGLQSFVQDEAIAAAEAEATRTESLLGKAQQTLVAARQKLADFQNAGTPASKELAPILVDDFAEPKSEFWKPTAGRWVHQNGHLSQLEPLDQSCELVGLSAIPQDFQARFRFKTTGGKTWKSVGLSFDAAGETDSVGVYLTAYAGGPRIQVMTKTRGQVGYPTNATKPFPTAVGEEHELQVFVRGSLLNIGVDGKLLLAYRLTEPRAAANYLRLWTYDATADFLALRVEALMPEAVLLESVAEAQSLPVHVPPTAETLAAAIHAAELALMLQEKGHAVSQSSRVAVQARITADKALYATPSAPNAKELSQAAVKAERELALKVAEQAVTTAEQAVSKAKADLKADDPKLKAALTAAETKLSEAIKAKATAAATLEQPLTENYTRLGTVFPTISTGRRLAFARWISSVENPLTARVAVNHLWLRHFGNPLVPTVFDFGLNGRAPSHPALLDWLAVEFMQSGWKMKELHRLMVTSRAYRAQSNPSGTDDPNLKIDPENVYLWRANSHRMEAEIIRDSTLAVSDQLDLTFGGPDLDPATGLTVPRRSLYFRSAKEKKVTFLAMFDSPNVVECYRRSESIVPQQALAMANSPLTLIQSRRLANSLTKECGTDSTPEATCRFIQISFQQILGRAPSSTEISECQNFLQTQTARFADTKNLTAFGSGNTATLPPSSDPHLRARENLIHVLLNHNEFLTIR